MTFRYETDAQGDPLVHRVDGQHPDRHYLVQTLNPVLQEIRPAFDIRANIYFSVIDYSADAINHNGVPQAGTGAPFSKNGGFVLLPGSFGREVGGFVPDSFTYFEYVVLHEIGHAFGAGHDHRDGAYIMSYVRPGGREQISACLAKWLAVHPYFNPDVPIEDTPPPTIEHINARGNQNSSTQQYPAGSTSVSVQFKVSDSEGLHQVLLFGQAREPHIPSVSGSELMACRTLGGETDAIVEFEYDGAMPSDPVSRRLSDFDEHKLGIVAVDRHGNRTAERPFYLSELSPHYRATLEGHTLEGYTGVASIAFSPNGAMLATGGKFDLEGKVWDSTSEKIVATLDAAYKNFGGKSTYVAFSPDGATLAYGAWETNLWDMATQTQIATFEPFVVPIAFSHDGAMLASSSTNGFADGWRVVLWDVKTRQKIATLTGHETFAGSVAFSPDDRILAATSEKTIKLWDLKTKQPIATLEGHKEGVQSLAFSPDGTMLASGGLASWSSDTRKWNHETVVLWDVKTKQVIATFSPENGTEAVAFSPDGAILVSAIDKRRSIGLWDVKTKQPVATFRGHTNGVIRMAFSPDGTTLASGDFDGNILLWDMSAFVTPVAVILDANLRAAIRDALGMQRFAPITVTEIGRLTTLDASNRNIHELDGIESATNLTEVNLEGNPLSSSAVRTHVPALRERGVAVAFDAPPTSDFSGDGVVNFTDFLQFAANYGRGASDAGYDARFDLDGDGEIGFGDFVIFAGSFGN